MLEPHRPDSPNSEKKYLDFVIGVAPDGLLIEHTCDPERLSNDFGKNPGSPNYKTPVCFEKAVLRRYHAEPEKYRIDAGWIIGDQLYLRADTEHPDIVMAYLGDLGTYWPIKEQHLWRGFNREPHRQPISDPAYRRGYLAERLKPSTADLSFRSNYARLQRDHLARHGWTLFMEPHADDRYCLMGVHLLVSDSASEFDTQCSLLAKLLNEALNVKALESQLKRLDKGTSIAHFHRFLEFRRCPNAIAIEKLQRTIQTLRSKGAAHPKGRDFDKQMTQLGWPERTRVEIHADLLTQADLMLVQLHESLIQ